ncbi:hypothetical protein OG21DRAFT_1055659 [Imleria badia]|nr:hypothetical protein OG21DRAFT_1055659 [Imleria badia]
MKLTKKCGSLQDRTEKRFDSSGDRTKSRCLQTLSASLRGLGTHVRQCSYASISTTIPLRLSHQNLLVRRFKLSTHNRTAVAELGHCLQSIHLEAY